MIYLCNSCHKKEQYKIGRVKQWQKGKKVKIDIIKSIKKISKKEMTYDIEMKSPNHNFIANGFISHNSHSVSYAFISYIELYLKTYYPVEFITSLLNYTDRGKENSQGEKFLKLYVNYARGKGIKVLNPDINKSQEDFSIAGKNNIMFGLKHIKGIGNDSKKIIKFRNYNSLEDFCEKLEGLKINKTKVESLIYAGAFDDFGDRSDLINDYNMNINRKKKYVPIKMNNEDIIIKERVVLDICISRNIISDKLKNKLKETKFSLPSDIVIKKMNQCSIIGIVNKIISCKIKTGDNIGNEYIKLSITDDYNEIFINIFGKDNIKFMRENMIAGDLVIIKNIGLHRESNSWNLKDKLERIFTKLKKDKIL